MSFSSILREILEGLQKLTALEQRMKDLRESTLRIESKIDSLSERVTRLEERQGSMRESLRSQIAADLIAQITHAQIEWKSNRDQLKIEVVEAAKVDIKQLLEGAD